MTQNKATANQSVAGDGIFNNIGTVILNDSSSVTGNIPDDCFNC